MDWDEAMQREMDEERRMLLRSVAILFSLASIAWGLQYLPHPLRVVVLPILLRAETVAARIVNDLSEDFGWTLVLPARQLPGLGESAADAAGLARNFRLLGRALRDLAHSIDQWTTGPDAEACDPADFFAPVRLLMLLCCCVGALLLAIRPSSPAIPALDTS